MAYQPVFVTIEDINGPAGQSHSTRKKVEWVDIWANTESGTMFSGRVKAESGYLRLGDNFEAEVQGRSVIIKLKGDN